VTAVLNRWDVGASGAGGDAGRYLALSLRVEGLLRAAGSYAYQGDEYLVGVEGVAVLRDE
jgi:hypothetical protein